MKVEDIALTMVPGLGHKGTARLLETFISAEKIFAASREELMHFAQLRSDIATNICSRKSFAAAEREMEYCRKNGITAIASTDDEYPPLLREIIDYPHVIYAIGDISLLQKRTVSIVGTRDLTTYGDRVCFNLVRDLGAKLPDLVTVSGLAFGIDASAHRSSLYANVPTVGVLANSLPSIMPTQHTGLARDIIEKGGTLISELHSQSKQNGTHYIARNRIIAALSSVTIVVESPVSGGSMVTADLAYGYDRVVMAVPGRMSDNQSKGCNILIRNNKAKILTSADDLIREMMWDSVQASDRVKTKDLREDLSEDQRGLLGCFRNGDPLMMDELVDLTGLDVSQISTLLMELEFAGCIRALPGGRYETIDVISTC